MKRIALALVCSLASLPAISASSGTNTLQEYLDLQKEDANGQADKGLIDATKTYMNGLANGFNYYNAMAKFQNQTQLFCMPSKLLLNVDLLDITIKSYVQSNENGEGLKRLKEQPVELAALLSLTKIYPCN
ncbi:hypothetical protein ACFL9S_07060 [Erwinia sp. AnSW2-5]|uniref:hypothetical protein n=1 Tax=Erwinia sp. AnSW2-5 TaxID=3367692 RepID=UPI00385DB77C